MQDEMVGQDGEREANVVSEEWLTQAPKVSDALKKGVSISVTTWAGRELTGVICDREQTGLLLDIRAPDVNLAGYVFLPWSSIEQARIREVAQRRVKVLPS
jgi:hypothetical protein